MEELKFGSSINELYISFIFKRSEELGAKRNAIAGTELSAIGRPPMREVRGDNWRRVLGEAKTKHLPHLYLV